tara:strand:+ start:287 stop:472 length:186 start_codon:yes stop_codon:yes gene_type:complete
MWIIVENDTLDDYVNILSDDDGNAVKFVDKISAWRYMELMCKDFGLDMEQLESGVELWRLH